QKPHCTAPERSIASWIGLSPSVDRPSTVVTSEPSASAAITRQEQTTSPSSTTEQEPHSPWAQALFDPNRPSSSRKTSRRLVGPAARALTSAPLRRNSTIMPGTSPADDGRGRRRRDGGTPRWNGGR